VARQSGFAAGRAFCVSAGVGSQAINGGGLDPWTAARHFAQAIGLPYDFPKNCPAWEIGRESDGANADGQKGRLIYRNGRPSRRKTPYFCCSEQPFNFRRIMAFLFIGDLLRSRSALILSRPGAQLDVRKKPDSGLVDGKRPISAAGFFFGSVEAV